MMTPKPEPDGIPDTIRDEMRLAPSPVVRWAYIIAGSVSLVLGLAGLLVPVVPTTPFLLVSAFCYARGSEKFYRWLLTNRYFGEYIRAWRDNRGLPLSLKIYVLIVLWIMFGVSGFIVLPTWPTRIPFLLVGVAVTIYIVRLPTRRS